MSEQDLVVSNISLEDENKSMLGNPKINCVQEEKNLRVPFYKTDSGEWCYIAVVDEENDTFISDKELEKEILRECKEKMRENGYKVTGA